MSRVTLDKTFIVLGRSDLITNVKTVKSHLTAAVVWVTRGRPRGRPL